ncbi:hypothetical protein KEM09_12115 [Carboxylicivirga mesophila]|uniref:Uncharacterized protein n=1 Tax=Carboxylicivirga mesophila TaxID=1166478 RepID=A0ABS5KAZ7_9BACT|nr:hypothetical protein [Carboxylicivirga mesophila]MBS2212155.1 hypothetical protein [Carboxylicivirga mesophila]
MVVISQEDFKQFARQYFGTDRVHVEPFYKIKKSDGAYTSNTVGGLGELVMISKAVVTAGSSNDSFLYITSYDDPNNGGSTMENFGAEGMVAGTRHEFENILCCKLDATDCHVIAYGYKAKRY